MDLSSVQSPGWMFDIGDHTTQLYGDEVNIRILSTKQDFNGTSLVGFEQTAHFSTPLSLV